MPISAPSTEEDTSWYAEANCPKFFDFSVALQAPCSTEIFQNPPLHDFVYESDEESRRFFDNAAASPASPRTMRSQHRMLDPRYFENPTYRHRPKTTFEDFVRAFERSRIRTQRRSLQVSRPLKFDSKSEESDGDASETLDSATSNRRRPESLRVRGNQTPQRVRATRWDDEEDDGDRTMDLTTPTLDSILTPVTLRRKGCQLTPSRLRNPSSVAKSLFTSTTPTASPSRRARPVSRPLRTVDNNAEVSRSSGREARPAVAASLSARPTTVSRRIPSRPPERISPFLQEGTGGSSSGSEAIQRKSGKSRPYIERPLPRSPRSKTGGLSGSVQPENFSDFSSPPSPPVREPSRRSRKGAAMPSLGSQTARDTRRKERGNAELKPGTISPLDHTPELESTAIGDAASSELEESAATKIEDPDLVRVLQDHNRRLRDSSRNSRPDAAIATKEVRERRRRPQSARLPARKGILADSQSATGDHQDGGQKPKAAAQTQNSDVPVGVASSVPSLNDLLLAENNRILQQRKERLEQRQKALQETKKDVLKSADGRISEPRNNRASAKVEFTAADNEARKPKAVGSASRAVPTEPARKPVGQRGMHAFRTRAKSSNTFTAATNFRRVLKPASSHDNVAPRTSGSTKISASDKIKASARQRRQEKRIESDVNTILSQHNSRIQGTKRGRL